MQLYLLRQRMPKKEKLFKDPVHGYISVPVEWCVDFIDTPIFQRLRHIEQTSMRPLYPAAHHDRFIHSLGTYHLARRLLQNLQKNTVDESIQKHLGEKRVEQTFLIAALMHDCGHAPFSHTFEGFYNYTEADTAKRAYDLLQKEFPNSDFKVDRSFDPAPHEAFSAVVLSRFYKDKLEKYGCDAELAARMITGCTYPDEGEMDKRILNRLIGLLNGKAIDVDKLDYILRDTWASGVQNTAIDVDRLLASVTLHLEDGAKIKLCFRKSALSVLQNVVDARNYLYEWVYNHHTVLYYAKLLDRSLRKLAKYFAKKDEPDFFWKMAFSLEPFEKQVPISNDISLFLPTDGDMIHLLKRYAQTIPLPDVSEILSHAPSRVPLWKTYAEFRLLFKGAPVMGPDICATVAKKIPSSLAGRNIGKNRLLKEEDVLAVSALAKHYVIEESHVHVLMDGSSKPFTELTGGEPLRKPMAFFYIFVPPEFVVNKQEIIAAIADQVR